VHALAVAWIYQAHLTPPPLPPVHEIELVAPLYVPPPPAPPPPPTQEPQPPRVTRARVQPRATSAPPPETTATEQLPVPPAPPAPADAPIGATVATETHVRPARPVHRPEPEYPSRARRLGREGYVTVRFTILASGALANIEVLDADPRGFFEAAATAALARWRYEPCEWNGVKVDQPGVTTRLRFELRS
jgi:protein TonB